MNMLTDAFFTEGAIFIIGMSIRGAVFTMLLLIFEMTAGGKILPKYRRSAWLAAAILFLVQPWFSFIKIANTPENSQPDILVRRNVEVQPTALTPVILPENAGAVKPLNQTESHIQNLIRGFKELFLTSLAKSAFYIWLCGITGVLSFVLICNLRFYLKTRKLKILENPEILSLVAKYASELKIKRKIILLQSDEEAVSTFGLIRPGILFPKKSESLSERELNFVILHEMYHIKHNDIILSYLYMLVIALHWFNPLSYIAFKRCKQAVESNCDEKVINKIGKTNHKEYGLTLIKMLVNGTQNGRFAMNAGICESKKSLKERMRSITFMSKRRKTYSLVYSFLFGIIFLSAICFGGVSCSSVENKGAQVKATAKAPDMILVRSKIIVIKGAQKELPGLNFGDNNFVIVNKSKTVLRFKKKTISNPKLIVESGKTGAIKYVTSSGAHEDIEKDFQSPGSTRIEFTPEYIKSKDAVKISLKSWGKPGKNSEFSHKWHISKSFTIKGDEIAVLRIKTSPKETIFIEIDGGEYLEVFYKDALELYQKKRYAEARKKLEDILTIDPHHFKAINLLKKIQDKKITGAEIIRFNKEQLSDEQKAAIAKALRDYGSSKKLSDVKNLRVPRSDNVLKVTLQCMNIKKGMEKSFPGLNFVDDKPVVINNAKLNPDGKPLVTAIDSGTTMILGGKIPAYFCRFQYIKAKDIIKVCITPFIKGKPISNLTFKANEKVVMRIGATATETKFVVISVKNISKAQGKISPEKKQDELARAIWRKC
jgi:beta-lactamase regulating signal transducer with metallopeptidase domain